MDFFFVVTQRRDVLAAEDSTVVTQEHEQAQLVADTIRKQDIVICTALIPGRPAPELVSKEMVETMKPIARVGFIPETNIWCAHTINPRPAMPAIENTIGL